MSLGDLINDLLMPLIFFGTVLAIVVCSLYFSHKNRVEKYRLIDKLLERGDALSPEMLESIGKTIDPGEKASPNNRFGAAVMQVMIGIGLAVFFWALTSYTGAPYFLIAIGVFPFVVGVARLIAFFYEKKASV